MSLSPLPSLPEFFQYCPPFYFLLMAVLLTWRYISYKADKFQYFMLDFCYYVNMSVCLQYFLAPSNCVWFKVRTMYYSLSMHVIVSKLLLPLEQLYLLSVALCFVIIVA